MRWDAGSIYKKIRKSKGLSQNEVCGTSISRTTLSKFENWNGNSFFDKFYKVQNFFPYAIPIVLDNEPPRM